MVRSEAFIDLDAVRHNVALLRSRTSAEVMAVVKADGYGHGILPAASAALEAGATWLGVAFLEEALTLRAAGITAPVLSWLAVPGEHLAAGVAADIDLSAGEPWAVAEIAAAARAAGRRARVHLEFDTGLSRAGAAPAAWSELLTTAACAAASGEVEIIGAWSHFAYADSPGHPTVARQVERFHAVLELARGLGVRPPVCHLANSAATRTLPAAHFDLVRPGIAVYGLSPVPQESTFDLVPAMTLRSHVAGTRRVPAGTGVSYGHTYLTGRETNLALVPLGYGDGVPRHGSNAGPVLVGGVRRAVSGRVCMDQFVVDVGDDEVRSGDEVVLFGPGTAGEPTAQDWADAAGTISYEIVTRIGGRVPRRYLHQTPSAPAASGVHRDRVVGAPAP